MIVCLCVFFKLLCLNFALAVDCCINCLYLSNAKHCTLSALDTACVFFKVSVSAVFCLDILKDCRLPGTLCILCNCECIK